MKDKPNIINEALENQWLHVFMIANPINAIVARMIIQHYGLSARDMICISLRATDTSFVGGETIFPGSFFTDRLAMKLFSHSMPGARLRKVLRRKDRPYLVYTSWMYPEAEAVVASDMCQGHIYIEEGQQTYYQAKTFSAENNHWAQRRLKITDGSIDHYFRDDYHACIGLSYDSFPLLEEEKKVVVRDFSVVKSLYTPQLEGVVFIGLMPAPRRVPEHFLENIAMKFVSEMPEGGVVKFHPGYSQYKYLKERFIGLISRLSEGKIICCADNVNLELEMMYGPKIFIGARSSVSRYAETFGSEYRLIEFDGYIPPII